METQRKQCNKREREKIDRKKENRKSSSVFLKTDCVGYRADVARAQGLFCHIEKLGLYLEGNCDL